MLRLMKFRPHRDRGAVAAIVTIILASGVVMGLAALVVDVGQLYSEREQLQSGADSGAQAVALACAMKRDTCKTDATSELLAKTYADDNASDGLSAIDFICGTDPGLTSCKGTGGTGGLTDCIGTRPNSGDYVEVHTKTEVKEGDFLLPFSFAQTLTGVGDGRTVRACARVQWGSPSGGLGLTFSLCDYNYAISHSHVVTGTPTAADEVALYVHGANPAESCDSGPSGSNLPGGFGWTDHDSSCLTKINADGTYGSLTGTGIPGDCKDELDALYNSKAPVALPIYKIDADNGSKGQYTLQGFTAFVITGWDLTGQKQPSWLPDSTVQCVGSGGKCVFGYFTTMVIDWDGTLGTTPIMGAVKIKTVG